MKRKNESTFYRLKNVYIKRRITTVATHSRIITTPKGIEKKRQSIEMMKGLVQIKLFFSHVSVNIFLSLSLMDLSFTCLSQFHHFFLFFFIFLLILHSIF